MRSDLEILCRDMVKNILTHIQDGLNDVKWEKPWIGDSQLPYNVESNKLYKGINILLLWAAKETKGYKSNRWGTYKTWNRLGAQVKKGEKATHVTHFSRGVKTDEATGEEKIWRAYRVWAVFNADQVDGYNPDVVATRTEVEKHSEAERLIDASGASIDFGHDMACYIPSKDVIHMPAQEAFVNDNAYYAVLFHELGHWTGHETRCDRDLKNPFGNDAYAFEELVAELTATFVCAYLGIPSRLREDHAKYLDTWASKLNDKPSAILSAASKASAAMEFLIGGNNDDHGSE